VLAGLAAADVNDLSVREFDPQRAPYETGGDRCEEAQVTRQTIQVQRLVGADDERGSVGLSLNHGFNHSTFGGRMFCNPLLTHSDEKRLNSVAWIVSNSVTKAW
jgi:hypothetical protein